MEAQNSFPPHPQDDPRIAQKGGEQDVRREGFGFGSAQSSNNKKTGMKTTSVESKKEKQSTTSPPDDSNDFNANMTCFGVPIRRKHVALICFMEIVFLIFCLVLNVFHWINVWDSLNQQSPAEYAVRKLNGWNSGPIFIVCVTFIQILAGCVFETILMMAICKRSKKLLTIHTYGEAAAIPVLFLNAAIVLGLCYSPYPEWAYFGINRPTNLILVALVSIFMGFMEILFLCCLIPITRTKKSSAVLCVHSSQDGSGTLQCGQTVSSDSIVVRKFTPVERRVSDDSTPGYETVPIIFNSSEKKKPLFLSQPKPKTSNKQKSAKVPSPITPGAANKIGVRAETYSEDTTLGKDSGHGSADHTLQRSRSGSDELYATPSKPNSPANSKRASAVSEKQQEENRRTTPIRDPIYDVPPIEDPIPAPKFRVAQTSQAQSQPPSKTQPSQSSSPPPPQHSYERPTSNPQIKSTTEDSYHPEPPNSAIPERRYAPIVKQKHLSSQEEPETSNPLYEAVPVEKNEEKPLASESGAVKIEPVQPTRPISILKSTSVTPTDESGRSFSSTSSMRKSVSIDMQPEILRGLSENSMPSSPTNGMQNTYWDNIKRSESPVTGETRKSSVEFSRLERLRLKEKRDTALAISKFGNVFSNL